MAKEKLKPVSAGDPSAPLLEVDDLYVEFHTRDGVAKAINGVSYRVEPGRTLAVVGESGSGKSVTAQTIMGILDMPPGVIAGGEIRFRGVNILALPEDQRRGYRGEHIAMIFQDALSALNPVFTVGDQIAEMFRIHRGLDKKQALEKAVELMEMVRIPAARERVKDYPHQFSGGMRQRIMIAMSISLDPEVLIADEPTTALDVTVQAQVMDLLEDLRREMNIGVILITHDLGVVAEVADTIAVMYAGRIVETGDVGTIFSDPKHPYTRGLMDSMPRVDQKGEELYAIKGLPPSLANLPTGCNFHPRCPLAQEICRREVPASVEVAPGHSSACHFWQEVGPSGS